MKGRSLILSGVFACLALGILFLALYGEISSEYRLACLVGTLTGLTMSLTLLRLGKVRQHELALSEEYRLLAERYEERNNHLLETNEALQQEIARHEITEELLQETQDYLNGIINSMPSLMIGVTQDGIVTLWNDEARQRMNLCAADVLGLPLFEIFPDLPADLYMVQQAIDTGVAQTRENVRQGDGSEATYTDVIVYPVVLDEFGGAVIRLDDVTMRVRLENMMIQNEKMLSLGELAAGMAHEINNPLSAVLQGVQNIRRRLAEDLPANRKAADEVGLDTDIMAEYFRLRGIGNFLDRVQGAGERAARIVTNMLEFSRSNSIQHSQVNLNELIEHSLDLAISTFDIPALISKQRIRVVKKLDRDLPLVMCSGAEIQQVMLNLLRNASQALASADVESPAIEVSTFRDSEDDNVIITVCDNGPGISEEVRQHIFEPFYTTKAMGKGTGLGLSVSYFIVTEHHHGSISVDSDAGWGSSFRIALPLEREEHSHAEELHSEQMPTVHEVLQA